MVYCRVYDIWNYSYLWNEVAVFLMDTQGAFDHENCVKGCSFIFALSTLISSVQIYNIMQQIQEDSLQHLQVLHAIYDLGNKCYYESNKCNTL